MDLNLESHIKPIIKTAKLNLSDLSRVAPFMTDFNKKVIFNSFSKTGAVNHKINRFHERVMRTLLNDETSAFKVIFIQCHISILPENVRKP